MVAVNSSPKTRYQRLSCRGIRPLTFTEASSRDKSEIENLNKGGPIAMADYTLINESNLADLKQQAESILISIANMQI